MSLIPFINSWNLKNYARRLVTSGAATLNNEYIWSCIDANQISLKMAVTPTQQLLVISSDQCVEELLDIWFMFKCLHIHVHCNSVLFNYTWSPTSSSSTNSSRSFRVEFINNKDLDQCLKLLRDDFPISIYSPTNFKSCIESTQPTRFHSMFFNETKDILAVEQATTMNIRADFIRQYLSTCIMDPAFFIHVNKYEQSLKKLLSDK